MGKFYDAIGYTIMKETSPGVWTEQIIERKHSGDVFKNSSKWQGGEQLNSDLNVDNRISIVGDPFAYENFHAMRYICWMGVKWQIRSAEVVYPRINLHIGGVYNEQTTATT